MSRIDRASSGGLSAEYAYCERLARAHYENFPVASTLLPKTMRPHVAAVYAFARIADDIADEVVEPLTPDERRARLDDWLARLHRMVDGSGQDREPIRGDGCVLAALAASIRSCRLPMELFDALISAFRQDTTTVRYATWSELFDYCRRSANPIGRLVLRIAGLDDRSLDVPSDAVCTALQLTNFWQDLEVDWSRGRLYVPEECWRPAGAEERDLTARHLTASWRRALAEATEKTRELFAEGRAIGDRVSGRLGFELRLTWLGGMRILERLERDGFDVFRSRPTLGARDAPVMLKRAITWKRNRQ